MKEITIKELFVFNSDNDPNCLIGDRFLCRGGTLLFVGASGIGKSTLTLQMVGSFALGKPFLGIKPAKPLKTVYVQAENDLGDLAEICQGLRSFLKISAGSPEEVQLSGNLKVFSEDSKTGQDFLDALRSLLLKKKPDIILIDPLLSYIGGDINQQEVVSRFLRNGLSPLLRETKTACILVHHTKKTNGRDAYAALGSSDLVNYVRAVVNITPATKSTNCDLYLDATKRGTRMGICNSAGESTARMSIAYGDTDYLSFEVVDDVAFADKGKPGRKKGSVQYDREKIKKYIGKEMDVKSAAELIETKEGCSRKQALRIAREILP